MQANALWVAVVCVAGGCSGQSGEDLRDECFTPPVEVSQDYTGLGFTVADAVEAFEAATPGFVRWQAPAAWEGRRDPVRVTDIELGEQVYEVDFTERPDCSLAGKRFLLLELTASIEVGDRLLVSQDRFVAMAEGLLPSNLWVGKGDRPIDAVRLDAELGGDLADLSADVLSDEAPTTPESYASLAMWGPWTEASIWVAHAGVAIAHGRLTDE